MTTEHLLTNELLHELSEQNSHPMDSSQLMLGLMALSTTNDPGNSGNSDEMYGVISRKVLRSLLSTLHVRDVATVRHCRRVAMLSVGIAEHLGWEKKELKKLEVAALLHDIGKIGVPDNILFKPGKLSPDEADLMSLHRNIAIDILQACRADDEVLQIVEQSHGFYNASNSEYKEIGAVKHQGARILAVADAYDSLRTDKAYRKAKQHEEILEILRKESGTQFDGNVVSALARWAETDGQILIENLNAQETSQDYGAPSRPQETIEASTFGHIFSYLYLLESLYDGFALVDSDMKLVLWNYNAQRLLGKPSAQMLGHTWTSRILNCADEHGAPLKDNDYPIKKVIASGEASTSTIQIQRADKRWVSVEMQTVPLFDKQNRLHGVASIFRDLSRGNRRTREYQELKAAASRDSLTAVANRGEIETQLVKMLTEFSAAEDAPPFSMIFLDVDFFKNINDTYGHTVGDQVLVDLARLLQHETYSGELVGRYGGEEFLILCPDTEQAQAFKRAERLRNAIPKSKIGGASDYHITASFGVAEVEPGDSVESLLRRADKALYMAKENGRNQSAVLTVDEMLNPSQGSDMQDERPDEPFVFQSSFTACTAADMLVYKLGGFVSDLKAKLLEVQKDHAKVQVGTYRFFWPFWGETDESQPVELYITFEHEKQTSADKGRRVSNEIEIHCEVRPLGKLNDQNVFEARALRLIKLLKSYFAAG